MERLESEEDPEVTSRQSPAAGTVDSRVNGHSMSSGTTKGYTALLNVKFNVAVSKFVQFLVRFEIHVFDFRSAGKIFPNKGRFYQHCADVHPETRKSTKVSSTKYKITCATKRETARRRSSRLLKPKTERKDLDPQSYIDENKPLINFIGYPKLVNKEEVIKREVDYTDLKLDCSIEILFKGDANSPIDAKILREYLKFIDFDTFKL